MAVNRRQNNLNKEASDEEIKSFEENIMKEMGIFNTLPTREQNQELAKIMETQFPHMDFTYL